MESPSPSSIHSPDLLGETMRILTTTLLTLALAATAFAGAPLDGDYDSTDIGGTIAAGRYTESWASGGDAYSPGTVLNAESWDGMNLGTEWSYSCGVLTSSSVLTDFVNAYGNGNRTYMKVFTGGTIWLSGTGPWGNGDPYYSGPITDYVEFETVQYTNFMPVAAVTNVQAIAMFDGYPDQCMAFSVANGVFMGDTDMGPLPADFPAFLDANCGATGTLGAWWEMMSMTLSIAGCAVSNEDMSFSEIKTMYRD